ncbi:MAG: hypothetical protein ACREP9_16310 [Candidatus Dormibacteraceae bacterium]
MVGHLYPRHTSATTNDPSHIAYADSVAQTSQDATVGEARGTTDALSELPDDAPTLAEGEDDHSCLSDELVDSSDEAVCCDLDAGSQPLTQQDVEDCGWPDDEPASASLWGDELPTPTDGEEDHFHHWDF